MLLVHTFVTGFTFLKSLHVKQVTFNMMKLSWEPKEEYSVVNYEVLWFTESGCDGQISLNKTTLNLIVKPCTTYHVEVYAFDVDRNTSAPLILKQLTGIIY